MKENAELMPTVYWPIQHVTESALSRINRSAAVDALLLVKSRCFSATIESCSERSVERRSQRFGRAIASWSHS